MDSALDCPLRSCSARWDFTDGRAVTVRAVLPEDMALASEFVARALSQQSRYQRFQTGLRELAPGMAAYLTQIDYRGHVALAAVALQDGREHQVGEARYVCDGGRTEHAEFALAVADAWQGCGLGGRLLRQLVRLARRHGVQRLYGDVLRTNQAMVALARSNGFVPERQGDARLVRMARTLETAPLAAPH